MGSVTSPKKRLDITPQGLNTARIYLRSPLRACPRSTIAAVDLPFSVTPLLKHGLVVQEYKPVVHRLRLSASP